MFRFPGKYSMFPKPFPENFAVSGNFQVSGPHYGICSGIGNRNSNFLCSFHDGFLFYIRWISALYTMDFCLLHDGLLLFTQWISALYTMDSCSKYDGFLLYSRWISALYTMDFFSLCVGFLLFTNNLL